MIDSPCHPTDAARTPAAPSASAITVTASAARRVVPTRNVDPDTGGSLSRDGRRITYKPRNVLSNESGVRYVTLPTEGCQTSNRYGNACTERLSAGLANGVSERLDVGAVVVSVQRHADAAASRADHDL